MTLSNRNGKKPRKKKEETKRMFPLVKSAEMRSLPKGKAGEKRRSSNSHLIPKMEQG